MDATHAETIEQARAALAARDLATASQLLATLPSVAFPQPGSVESVRRRLMRDLTALADAMTPTDEPRVYADPVTGQRWRSIDPPRGHYDELYEAVA